MTDPRPPILTVAEAAAELKVSFDLVMKWAKEGRFHTFLPPGARLGGNKTGPKVVRIRRDDWDGFIRAHLVCGEPTPTQEVPAPGHRTAEVPTGTDGVKRLKVRRDPA